MTVRKDVLAAYERFALKGSDCIAASTFIPGIQIRREKERPMRPPPPASKPVREPYWEGAHQTSARGPVDPLDVFRGQSHALMQLVEMSAHLAKERDAWKAMAESLTANQTQKPAAAQEDKRVEALRRLLARELHPDRAEPSSTEGALLNDLFQRLWPQIDRIAKGQTAQ